MNLIGAIIPRSHALPEAICSVCGGPCKVNRYRAPRCKKCASKQHGPQLKRAREYVPEPEPEMARIELPPCTGKVRIVDGVRYLSCPVDCPRHSISKLSQGWNRTKEQFLYAPGYDSHTRREGSKRCVNQPTKTCNASANGTGKT